MSQNYFYLKNNFNYHSLPRGDKGLISEPFLGLSLTLSIRGCLQLCRGQRQGHWARTVYFTTSPVPHQGFSVSTPIRPSSWQSRFP